MGNKEDYRFGDLKDFLKKKPKKEEEPVIETFEEVPLETSKEVLEVETFQKKKEIIAEHPIVQQFTKDMKHLEEEVKMEEIAEGIEMEISIQDIIDKIEDIEKNYDLEILQKLITVKNVLNYTQSTWSLGVCNEILGEGSLRGGKKQVGNGLIRTIKKICNFK